MSNSAHAARLLAIPREPGILGRTLSTTPGDCNDVAPPYVSLEIRAQGQLFPAKKFSNSKSSPHDGSTRRALPLIGRRGPGVERAGYRGRQNRSRTERAAASVRSDARGTGHGDCPGGDL